MKLELKHIAPYLPYSLPCVYGCILGVENDYTESMDENNIHRVLNGYGSFVIKPILRPLSDLTEYVDNFPDLKEFIDEEFCTSNTEMVNAFIESEDRLTLCYSYDFWNTLFKLHIDVFGLIDNGLAIDINTLKG